MFLKKINQLKVFIIGFLLPTTLGIILLAFTILNRPLISIHFDILFLISLTIISMFTLKSIKCPKCKSAFLWKQFNNPKKYPVVSFISHNCPICSFEG